VSNLTPEPIVKIDGHQIKVAAALVEQVDGKWVIEIESPGRKLGAMIAIVSPGAIVGTAKGRSLQDTEKLERVDFATIWELGK